MRGILLAIEGIDGAGKSTQAAAVAQRLESMGLEVVRTKEPTSGPWGAALRASAATGRLPVEEELRYFLEDRREHVRDLINPALEAGKVVIVDRYYFSTVAYQGARGLNQADLLEQNESFAPAPDLLVFLDVEPDVGIERIRKRGDRENYFEQPLELAKVAREFRQLSKPYLLPLDGNLPIEAITDRIVQALCAGPLFRATCPKGYKQGCEPAYCVFSEVGQCEYLKCAGQLAACVGGGD